VEGNWENVIFDSGGTYLHLEEKGFAGVLA
jgi:hypothetical protein